ncbi:hypothetical protein B6D52_00960 [Candidatus Parcubacteria bacterium 4484_255]|nr:MAG: hypothetical protein B6D52_00960 [Candidatus Parcubacteria bacterium 4484_255]
MQKLSLSTSAQQIIDSYLKMKIGNKTIACPYFINHFHSKAGLRVFLGKGTANEIIEEIKIIAQQKNINLETISKEELYKLLNKRHLGIDCSALATYILKSEYEEKKQINIIHKIHIVSFWKNPFRYLISLIRPIENISVKVLASNKNSREIKDINQILPGDMIIRYNLRHVLLVKEIEIENNVIQKITLVHAPKPIKKEYKGPGVQEIKASFVGLSQSNIKNLQQQINEEKIIIRRLKF